MTAIWTTPRSWSTSELLTAALLNEQLRDNLDWLKTPPSTNAALGTTFTTTSTTLADVLSMSITPQGNKVQLGGHMVASMAGAGQAARLVFLVNGVQFSYPYYWLHPVANYQMPIAFSIRLAGLTPGTANTIKLQAAVGVAAQSLSLYGTGFGVNSEIWAREI